MSQAGSTAASGGGGGGGITTINGDTGSITGSTVTIYADNAAQNSGSTVKFVNSGTISTLNVSDSNSNTLIGNDAGNATLTGNTNSGIGGGALLGLTSGSSNSVVGSGGFSQVLSGSNNAGIGTGVGFNYDGSESNNILLNSKGITGDNNTLRIGDGTGTGDLQLNSAYIQGVYNNSQAPSASVEYVTINNTTGQLGASNGSDLHAARYIVSPGGTANGANYTTIANAYAAAVTAGAPQTVFVQPGTYTENLSLTAGINLCAFDCDSTTPNVTIIGEITASYTGNCSISGIRLQTNSAPCIGISGSGSQSLYLSNCFINASNNNAIVANNASSTLFCNYSTISSVSNNQLFAITNILGVDFNNSTVIGGTTVNTIAAGAVNLFNSKIQVLSITTSGTGNVNVYNSFWDNSSNLIAMTLGGSVGSNVAQSIIFSGTASAMSIGSSAAATVVSSTINSSNSFALTGTGTINYGGIVYSGTSITNNVTTQNIIPWPVIQGGTAQTTYATGDILYASATNVLSKRTIGSTNNVLTVTGGVPTWAAAQSGVVTITGDSGSATGSSVKIFANTTANNCGASVNFTNATATSTLNITDANSNVFLGKGAGKAGVTGANNSCQGALSLASATSADSNCGLGSTCLTTLTTGTNNCAVGVVSLQNLVSGSNCVAIGHAAGQSYTGSESNNICIGSAVTGTAAESNTTRIGTASTTSCFIGGITGATVTGTAVLCSSTGQLGTIASSQRYKENINDIDDSLSILDLNPVVFNYKTDESKTKVFGLIAEDVHEKFPDLCVYNNEGQPDAVKYHEMTALLLKEIQRLNDRILKLEMSS